MVPRPSMLALVLKPFLVALAAGVLATWLVRALARRLGAVDTPGGHKQHALPVATLGGIAVYLAFVAGILARGEMSRPVMTMLQAGAFLVLVGAIDDLRGVGARVKLGCLALACLYFDPQHFVFTFLWLGLIASAYNGVDNADGAAPGLAAIAALAVFAIAWVHWQRDLALIALALAGACAGFLVFNKPRASIFLGDSGSLFVGFALGAMTLMGHVSALVLAVPLFDFALILLARGLAGQYTRWSHPITMCARDHVFHRLRALGLTHWQALGALYGASVGVGLLAFFQAPLGALVLIPAALWLGRIPLPGVYGSEATTR